MTPAVPTRNEPICPRLVINASVMPRKSHLGVVGERNGRRLSFRSATVRRVSLFTYAMSRYSRDWIR